MRAIVYAMTGAFALPGGIAAHNRNVLAALTSLASHERRALHVLSLHESDADRWPGLPSAVAFEGFSGNTSRFSWRLVHLALRRPLIAFDHVRLAMPILPLMLSRALPTVIFAHGSESWRRVRRSSTWLFRAASLCLTNSEFTLRRMRERIGAFSGKACLLGLPPEWPLQSTPPAPPREARSLRASDGEERELRDRVLLLVGRLDPREGQKGHRQLVEALPTLRREYPETQLVFPGPGSYADEIRELARSHGVGAAVFVPGEVSQEDLADLYRRCYALAMPSRQEGFGLVYLEAMNYAKSCVGCLGGGAEDVIVDGETGLLVADPDDPAELTGTLRKLLGDPPRADHFGRKGFERLHEKFTSSHHQTRVRSEISRVLEGA